MPGAQQDKGCWKHLRIIHTVVNNNFLLESCWEEENRSYIKLRQFPFPSLWRATKLFGKFFARYMYFPCKTSFPWLSTRPYKLVSFQLSSCINKGCMVVFRIIKFKVLQNATLVNLLAKFKFTTTGWAQLHKLHVGHISECYYFFVSISFQCTRHVNTCLWTK